MQDRLKVPEIGQTSSLARRLILAAFLVIIAVQRASISDAVVS